MIGLALQGGGARGAYQIGAYYAFKKKHIKFNGVCGTSIGAFNGALIASGKEKELLHFWANASIGEILGFDKEFISKKIKHEYDFSYLKLGIKNFGQIMKSHGIATDGLKQVLDTYLEDDLLLKSKMDFGICTIRVKDLKPLYIFKENMNPEKIKDYILASCYLPFFKMEKKVDNHYYLDGGFYDNTPINMLIEKGYKKIYVVELNPLLNINRKPKNKNVEIIKITPKRSLGGVLIYDNETLKENIKMGYYDTLRVIKNLDGYHYCFKSKSNYFYDFITRKVNQKLLRRVYGFFRVKNNKEAVIKALEYVMQKENMDYYKVYKPYKMIKQVKKISKNKHFVSEFLRQVKFL